MSYVQKLRNREFNKESSGGTADNPRRLEGSEQLGQTGWCHARGQCRNGDPDTSQDAAITVP